MGWFSRQMERSRRYAEEHQFDAVCDGWHLSVETLSHINGFRTDRWSVIGAHAEAISGPSAAKLSLGRVAAGGAVLGRTGALLGGMAKRDRTHCYLVVSLPDGQEISTELPADKFGAALNFASRVNSASAVLGSRKAEPETP